MSARFVAVMLCNNDRNGTETEKCDGFHFDSHDTGTEVDLQCDGLRLVVSRESLRFRGITIPIVEWKPWVGNMAWNQVVMTMSDALLLLLLLFNGERVRIESSTLPHDEEDAAPCPLAQIVREYDHKQLQRRQGRKE